MLPSLVPERICGLWTVLKRANLCVYGSHLYFLGASLPATLPQDFWTSRDEIQNCHPGSDVPRLAVSSSPEEWEKSGRTLFSNKRYLQAMHCFERAGLNREVAVSNTYYLRELARSTPIASSKSGMLNRQTAFLAAAQAFVECSGSAKSTKEKRAYFRSAGECFEQARDDYRAAQLYSQAEEYNTAVRLYRKCARFDEAVAIVTHNRREVEEEVAENIIGVARLFYFKGGELEYVHFKPISPDLSPCLLAKQNNCSTRSKSNLNTWKILISILPRLQFWKTWVNSRMLPKFTLQKEGQKRRYVYL